MRRRRGPDTRPLRAIGLDNFLTSEQLDHLAFHADVLHVESGRTLARSGNIAREFIGVIDGEIDVRDRTGRRSTVGPGAHIGAEELHHGRRQAASAVTTTECTLVVIFGPAFAALTRSAWPRRRHPTRRTVRRPNVGDPYVGERTATPT